LGTVRPYHGISQQRNWDNYVERLHNNYYYLSYYINLEVMG